MTTVACERPMPLDQITENTDAYLYKRVSKPSQVEGTGLHRQEVEDAAPYLLRKKLTLRGTFEDAGISSFTGANINWGELGKVRDRVEAGEFPPGTNFLFANVDRMLRMGNRKTARLVDVFMDAKCVLHFINHDLIIDEHNIDDPSIWIKLGLEAHRAHGESKTKSLYLKKTRQIEREKVRNGDSKAAISRLPGWLTPQYTERGRRNGWLENVSRVALVVRIFEMAADGYSSGVIARILNEEWKAGGTEAAPWGLGHKRRKHDGVSYWRQSTVIKMLHNRQVLGEYQPCSAAPPKPGQKRVQPVPDGEAIPHHFPQIVPTDLFYRAQAAIHGRQSYKVNNSTAPAQRNLIAGLAFCGVCHTKMYYRASTETGPGGNKRIGRMACGAAYDSACPHLIPNSKSPFARRRRIEYRCDEFMMKLVAFVDEINLGTSDKTSEVRQLDERLGQLRDAMHRNRKSHAVLIDDDELTTSLVAQIKKLDRAYEAMAKEAEEIEGAVQAIRGAPAEGDRKAELSNVRALVAYEDWNPSAEIIGARTKVNSLLKQFVERIEFRNGVIEMRFKAEPNIVYLFDAEGEPTGTRTTKAA